jgi:hypothetical protein
MGWPRKQIGGATQRINSIKLDAPQPFIMSVAIEAMAQVLDPWHPLVRL